MNLATQAFRLTTRGPDVTMLDMFQTSSWRAGVIGLVVVLGSLQGVALAASGPVEQEGAANRLSEGRRDDLARFRFKYAEVDGSDRELWISETCYNSGVLRAVPQWEDAVPWVFKSVSETTFEQVNETTGAKPVRLEFEVHHGHGGVEAVIVSGGAKGRFEEAGYLPEGFEPEMGTCD